MHLSFQAAQTDASRAGESFIHLHPNMLKLHKDASEKGKSYLSKKGAQSSLQAGSSNGEEKR
jgi:hypothetical protein